MGTPIHERGYTSVPLPFVLQYPANALWTENSQRKRLWRVSFTGFFNLVKAKILIIEFYRDGISCPDFNATHVCYSWLS